MTSETLLHSSSSALPVAACAGYATSAAPDSNQRWQAPGSGPLTPHGLRHTAASLAIATGADVKVIQTILGHKSATMTLDLYGHLFADQLDDVANAMDAARSAERIRETSGDVRAIVGPSAFA